MPQYNDGSSSSLSDPKRYITVHDEQGKAVFAPPESEKVELKLSGVAAFHVHYATTKFPVNFTADEDLKTFWNPKRPETIANLDGSVCRMVDIKPDSVSPMHRTQSLDYGVVLDGEVDLILESLETGPVRRMRVGDVSVQRGTMHAWRNASKDKWARMLYVLVGAEPIEVGGKMLGEDYGGIEVPK